MQATEASDRSKRQEQAAGVAVPTGALALSLASSSSSLSSLLTAAAFSAAFARAYVQAREFREHAALDTNKSMCRRGSKGEASGGLRARTFVLQSGRRAPAGV